MEMDGKVMRGSLAQDQERGVGFINPYNFEKQESVPVANPPKANVSTTAAAVTYYTLPL